MRGKEKCKALKEIRRQIAEQNDIAYAVSECTHQGECKGTCPKCESELRYLERELAVRQGLGKAVAVAGITFGVCTSLTGCYPIEAAMDFVDNIFEQPQYIQGDVIEIQSSDREAEDPTDYEGGLEEYDPDEPESSEADSDGDEYANDPEALAGDVEYIGE